MEELDYI